MGAIVELVPHRGQSILIFNASKKYNIELSNIQLMILIRFNNYFDHKESLGRIYSDMDIEKDLFFTNFIPLLKEGILKRNNKLWT